MDLLSYFLTTLFSMLARNISVTCISTAFIGDDLHYYEPLTYNPQAIRMHQRRHKRSNSNQNDFDKVKISFFAHNQEFRLHLKRDYSIFHNNMKIHDGTNQHVPLNHDTLNLYDGIVESSLSSSNGYCFGSISDGIFDGQLLTEEGTYYVTKIPPSMSHVLNYTVHSIIYNEKHVKMTTQDGAHTCGVKDSGNKWMDEVESFDNDVDVEDQKKNMNIAHMDVKTTVKAQQAQYRPKREVTSDNKVSSRKLCSLYIRTDGMLWDAIEQEERTRGANEKTMAKITELVHRHVKKLNLIMENTFFSNKINTVVFQIVKLEILNSTYPFCKPFCDRNLDSSPFLDVQSQKDHSEYCLAYAFTYRDWTEGTLGVAWIAGLNQAGGICENHQRVSLVKGFRSRNTGVVTLKNSGRRIPIPKSELTFAHEVGHNLGSPHDESSKCLPEKNGKYLMYPYSNSGNLPNHGKFSECSKEKIGVVFDEMKRLDGCLENFDGSFCGDGILDDGM